MWLLEKSVSREMLSQDKKNERRYDLREIFPILDFQINNVAFDMHWLDISFIISRLASSAY